jgi:carbon-monoxide dehydrogenase medium subunit
VSVRRGGSPAREIPIEQFTRGPYETALEPGELLTTVHIPALPTGSALVHRKMSFHERPAITVAVNVAVQDGVVAEGRIVVGSIGLTPQRLTGAERVLTGATAVEPRPEQLRACADAAAVEAQPIADANGSVEYKRQLVRVLIERSAREALSRAAAD